DRLRDIGASWASRRNRGEFIERYFRLMQQREQQKLRTRTFGTHGNARAFIAHIIDRAKLEWISVRKQKSLLPAAERNHDGIVQVVAILQCRDVGVGIDVV